MRITTVLVIIQRVSCRGVSFPLSHCLFVAFLPDCEGNFDDGSGVPLHCCFLVLITRVKLLFLLPPPEVGGQNGEEENQEDDNNDCDEAAGGFAKGFTGHCCG